MFAGIKFAVVLAAIGIVAMEASACSCNRCDGKLLTENEYVDTIFAAEVVSVRKTTWWENLWTGWLNPPWEDQRLVYTFRPIEVVKGRSGKQVQVRTAEWPSMCGVRFEILETVGVAAKYRNDGVLTVNSCTQLCWEESPNQQLLSVEIYNSTY